MPADAGPADVQDSTSQPAAAEAQTIAGQAIPTSHAPGAGGTVLSHGGHGVTVAPFRSHQGSGLLFAEAIGIPVFIAYIGDPEIAEEAGWIFAERDDEPYLRGWIPAAFIAADSSAAAYATNAAGASSPGPYYRDNDSIFASGAFYDDGSTWL